MFEDLRIGSMLPQSSNSYGGGGYDSFMADAVNFMRGKKQREDQINDAILQHQLLPINRYAPPLTTNNLVSTGINNANPQIATMTGSPKQAELDLKKLQEAGRNNRASESLDSREKIAANKESGMSDRHDTDADIRQQRANTYKYKTEHPNHIIREQNGRTVAIDPQTNSVTDLGASGHLNDLDKLTLAEGNREKLAKVNSELNIGRDNNRSTNNLTEIGARGSQTREINAAKPNNKLISNSQIDVGHISKAQELLNSDPGYAQYIKLSTSGNGKVNGFHVEAPNGPDDLVYHQINAKIYGNNSDVAIPSSDKTNDKNKSDKSKDSSKSNETGSSGSKYKVSITPGSSPVK